jgi:hypothetical protein
MVKPAVDVSPVVDAYLAVLKRDLGVERLILSDVQTAGIDGEATEIVFIVASPIFEGMSLDQRIERLVILGLDVSPLIQAWGYTPGELAGVYGGESPDLLLPQLLHGSREVYVKPGSTPLQKLQKKATGERR